MSDALCCRHGSFVCSHPRIRQRKCPLEPDLFPGTCAGPGRCRDPDVCTEQSHAGGVQDGSESALQHTGAVGPLLFPAPVGTEFCYVYLTSWKGRCLLLAPGLSCAGEVTPELPMGTCWRGRVPLCHRHYQRTSFVSVLVVWRDKKRVVPR